MCKGTGRGSKAEQLLERYPEGVEGFWKDFDEFERNSKWLIERNVRLSEKYRNEFVAVLSGKVVDHDSDSKNLWNRLRKKYGKKADVIAVEYIPEKDVLIIF
ncbi:MAG: DUF5678 domain-containing protein [Candidatus Thermoplasmatota archaeon]